MPQKHHTREQIHTGLTAVGDDNKWSDMLNIRSANNRSFAVAPRRRLFSRDAGFHTILHGINNQNYAIGSNESWCFRGSDHTTPIRLWRAIIDRVLKTEDASEGLKLRGCYTGNKVETFVLTLVATEESVRDFRVARELVEQVVLPPSLYCGKTFYKPKLHVLVIDDATEEPIGGAEVKLFNSRTFLEELMSNANGLTTFAVNSGLYDLQVLATGYYDGSATATIGADDVDVTVRLARNLGVRVRNFRIVVRYDAGIDDIHSCDAAVYFVKINGVSIGIANLNNKSDSGSRLASLIVEEQYLADIVAAGTSETQVEVSLVCNPDYPGFNLLAYGGGCHPDLPHMQIYKPDGSLFYDGYPSAGSILITP